jgi:uracil phosphoribosyltransferase
MIQLNRDNEEALHESLPTVRCSFQPSKYERILMTRLRDRKSSTKVFRNAAEKIGEILVGKVVECIPTTTVEIKTPVTACHGELIDCDLDFVSVMRSGDALLNIFIHHFPKANVSKILIQRDEESAQPLFKYMKLSPSIAQDHPIIITEPMVATGGTLEMVIQLLKDQGVKEENIIIACICAAPEGLLQLSTRFPKINIVMTFLDEKLNDKKYIVPGLGDFGDRFFGTTK